MKYYGVRVKREPADVVVPRILNLSVKIRIRNVSVYVLYSHVERINCRPCVGALQI